MDSAANRFTAQFANQVRRSLTSGECTLEEIAHCEGMSAAELQAVLDRHPEPTAPAASGPRPLVAEPTVVQCALVNLVSPKPRKRRPPRPPRHDVAAMYAEYEAGATLEQVGAGRGITRERARQLFAKAGLPTRSRSASWEFARLRALEAATPFRDEIMLAWRGGAPSRVIARRLGLLPAAVEQIVEQGSNELDRRRHRAKACGAASKPVKATQQNCIASVCEARRLLGHVPTSAEYDRLAKHHAGWPAAVTIAMTWGWRATLEAAGLAKRRGYRSARSDKVPPERCWEAVHQVAREVGRIPSCQDYEAASRGRADLPSLAVVRRRLGGWRAILAAWPGPAPSATLPVDDVWDKATESVRSAGALLGHTPTLSEYDEMARAAAWMRGAFICRRWGWAATVRRAGMVPHRGRVAA